MTRDDIIRMAQQSWWEMPPSFDETDGFCRRLERFANLVAKQEREACAKLFDGEVWAYDYREIAAAIRARGEE